MADRVEKFNKLPDRLKQVSGALKELNEVISGGAFDNNKIWGATAEDNITSYMESLTVSADLHATVQKLLGGLPGSSQVSQAIQAALSGVQDVIRKIQDTADDLTKEGGDRIGAFNQLNDAHSSDPAYNYQPGAGGKFGFIPAIEGVVNSASGANVDVDKILGPLKAVADYANAGLGIADFTEYSTASIKFLGKALAVS